MGALAVTGACSQGGMQQAGATTLASQRRRLERIGIQLYTVRQQVQRDLPATLARLSEIGYREVEFAGYAGRTPEQTKALLSQYGLAAPSTHIGYDQLGANWDRALDDALARGHRYVTVPWLPDAARSAEASRRVADEFNRAAEAARRRGLRFAYHNHDFEFVRTGNTTPFDILLANTNPDFVDFQLDVYWAVKAGADPLALIRQHPTRFTMLHIKDSGGPPDHKQVDVGAGTIDFAAILRLDESQRSVIEHVFIEHDQPADPMAFAKASFDHLSRLEY
jgi:sugar phosphate isomerase/epimerase